MKSIDKEGLAARMGGGHGGAAAVEALAAAGSAPPARTLDRIGAEIREHTAALEFHARATIWEAVEIGRRLAEAKDLCKHGEWLEFLRAETGFSDDKARNLIRVFEGYGAQQKSLFGPELSNSDTYRNLTFSKALALLAIEDPDERQEFYEEKNVEGMGTRELKEALRERDEAKKAAEQLGAKVKEAEEEARMLRDARDEENERAEAAEEARKAAEDKWLAAVHDANILREQIKELEARPVDVAVMSVDQEAINKARAEAVAEVQAKLDKALDKAKKAADKLKAAEEDKAAAVAAVQGKLDEANRALDEARKREAQAQISNDKELVNFQVLFDQAKEKVNVMHGILLKVRGRGDEELAGKLGKALAALSEAVARCAG